MTTDEAVEVAKIMVDPKLRGSDMVTELLLKFEGVDWTEFFNAMDDYLDTVTHDWIMYKLDQRQRGKS